MKQLLSKKFLVLCLIAGLGGIVFSSASHQAVISDGYPGYPNTWEGLTTNTVIKIDLDEPVAMIGDQPDMDFCVTKGSFNGFDMVFTEVDCDVDVADDRKTIRLYPLDLLEKDSLYAYKIETINFAGGGTDQDYSQCYATGNNPIPLLDTVVAEADMCADTGGSVTFGNFCARCHTDFAFITCVITPNDR